MIKFMSMRLFIPFHIRMFCSDHNNPQLGSFLAQIFIGRSRAFIKIKNQTKSKTDPMEMGIETRMLMEMDMDSGFKVSLWSVPRHI